MFRIIQVFYIEVREIYLLLPVT